MTLKFSRLLRTFHTGYGDTEYLKFIRTLKPRGTSKSSESLNPRAQAEAVPHNLRIISPSQFIAKGFQILENRPAPSSREVFGVSKAPANGGVAVPSSDIQPMGARHANKPY